MSGDLGIAFALVISSGAIHSVWNLFAKRSRNKGAFLWHSQWVSIVVFLPWVARDFLSMTWNADAACFMLISMLLHAIYTFLLARAYTIGDLSQVYPIMRGTSPLLVPVVGVLFLQESLSAWGWAGIAAIVTGIGLISGLRAGKGVLANKPAVLYALSIGVCIASYIVMDKLALEHVPLFALNASSNIGNLCALAYGVVRAGELRSEWKLNKWTIGLVGIMAPGGYLLFLLALGLADVAALAPMREIGTAFGAMLGVWLLKEPGGSKRLPAAALITLGVIVMGIYH